MQEEASQLQQAKASLEADLAARLQDASSVEQELQARLAAASVLEKDLEGRLQEAVDSAERWKQFAEGVQAGQEQQAAALAGAQAELQVGVTG